MSDYRPFKEQVAEFIGRLEHLDAAARARLKRNAGKTLAEARDVYRVFYQALPFDVANRWHDDYFLIASLYPLADSAPNVGNFGDTMRQVRESRSGIESRANSLDRRFEALLDSDREQLPFRLRQAVRLANASKIGINWQQLLLDVINWEQAERRTQLQWARSYFAHDKEN